MINEVINKVLSAKKYENIHPSTVKRTAERILEEDEKISDDEAVKKIKKELYTIHAHYYNGLDYKKALNSFRKNPDNIKNYEHWLRKYDNNRLKSVKNDCYEKIFRITGKPRVILDLACGLNPLTLQWMNLDKNAEYYCYDIEKNMINFLNEYFRIIKMKKCSAFFQDVVSRIPEMKADVAFIFKASTCFEWQKAGNTMKVLNGLKTKYAVISLMMRGEYNLDGCRNYFRKLLGEKYDDSYEVVSEKEYFRILKK